MSGDILLSRFYQEKTIKTKGPKDIVTDVDIEIEKLIFEQLTNHYPEMSMIGEESFTGEMPSGFVWVVDPIDGTRNFAAGIPIFSIVVALSYEGEVVAGANFDPKKSQKRRLPISIKQILTACTIITHCAHNVLHVLHCPAFQFVSCIVLFFVDFQYFLLHCTA